MQSDGGKLKTWLKVADGPGVKNHGIDISVFATICQNIQSIFDNIGKSKYGDDYNKEDCHLYFNAIEKGSVVVSLYPSTYSQCLTVDTLPPFATVSNCFDRIVSAHNISPEHFQNQLEEEISGRRERIGILDNMQKISDTGAIISVKTSVNRPDADISFPGKDDKLLSELLTKYKENGEETVQGVIVSLSGDKKNYYFIIRTIDNKLVKCFYNPVDEDRVKDLYKKWVSVTGNYTVSRKTPKITNITSLTEQQNEVLTVVGDYVLQKPITFKTSYDNEDGLWGMVNEELALYGYGENYNKTLRSLEDQLEGHVLSFTEYPDDRHSETSLKLKKLLSEHIDIKEAGKQMNGKYEEY